MRTFLILACLWHPSVDDLAEVRRTLDEIYDDDRRDEEARLSPEIAAWAAERALEDLVEACRSGRIR